MEEVSEMKKWTKFIVVFMVIAGFVLSISAPTGYAWPSTQYHNDWMYPSDDIMDPPFVDTEYLNVHVADFRGTYDGFWVVYRKDCVIFALASVKDNGKTEKKEVELTKDMYCIWSQYFRIIYKIPLKAFQDKGSKYTHKIGENSWEFIWTKPAIMYPIPDCEIKDLVSGKILKDEGDGWFASNHFTVTIVAKPK